MSWVDPIAPDSRQRKRRRSLSSETSGEEFDFGLVERMEDSDIEDAGCHSGPSSRHEAKALDPPSGNVLRFELKNKGSGKSLVSFSCYSC